MEANIQFTPTEFLAVVNQTLEYAYSQVSLIGEVSSFKINQGKWVFFDIKDGESNVACFMTLYQLRVPLEDGMKVVVRGTPKVTKWGRFSFTVNNIIPAGAGSIKKAYELLKKKLADEGLFDASKKRELPKNLSKVGVISSTAAAGYADFIKILNERWGGLDIKVAHTQVQGMDAPDQIIRALKYFNEHNDVQVVAIIRGGGSADDLACFNDEALVREIAASKIPVITGIGHEVDESLADLAADVRASTPSNAAQLLTLDKNDIKRKIGVDIQRTSEMIRNKVVSVMDNDREGILQIASIVQAKINECRQRFAEQTRMLEAMNPEQVLRQGYALLRGDIFVGNVVKITTYEMEIKALIKEANARKKNPK